MMKTLRYPLSFALAFMLYSGAMKEAMLAGAIILSAEILSCVLREALHNESGRIIAPLVSGIYAVLVLIWLLKSPFSALITGLGVAYWCYSHTDQDHFDYGTELSADTMTYVVLVTLAIIREYLGTSCIFDTELPKTFVVSPLFAHPAAGIVLGAAAAFLFNWYKQKEESPF